MAEWKVEIRRLASDFCIPRMEILRIFKKVEQVYAQREMPEFYKGNRNNFLYDKAQREIMDLIYA